MKFPLQSEHPSIDVLGRGGPAERRRPSSAPPHDHKSGDESWLQTMQNSKSLECLPPTTIYT